MKDWFRGKYIPSSLDGMLDEKHPDQGKYDSPWPTKYWLIIRKFIAIEWKWLIGFVIAIIALYLNFFLKR